MRRLAAAVSVGSVVLGLCPNGFAATSPLPVQKVLPVELAMDAARVAIATCRAAGSTIAVAVVDSGGGLRLLAAAPGANSISVELSQRKARTAALFRLKSGEIGERFQQSPGFAQAVNGVDARLSGGQGAAPISAGGEPLGGIGASGAASGQQDEACVLAGLASITPMLQ